MKKAKWKILSVNRIYEGRISLREDTVELPNKHLINHIALEYPESVAVVPITTENKIILIRQYRYIVDEFLWEIPAGSIENGECPEIAAQRELEEETGYFANELKYLISYYTNCGTSNHVVHLFLAQNLTKKQQSDFDMKQIDVHFFDFDKAIKMIKDGQIQNGFALIGILIANQLL